MLQSREIAHAQEMKDIFINAPKRQLPILPKPMREKLVEQYLLSIDDVNSPPTTVSNPLGAPSFIKLLTPSYIRVVLDKKTDVQYKLLYTKEGEMVIGMIATSYLPPRQSIIKFYDRLWDEIPSDHIIKLPQAPDFLRAPQDSTLSVFKNAMVERGSIDLYADFLPNEDTLMIHLSTFDEETARRLHPGVLPLLNSEGLRYTWDAGQFKKTNQK